jgi:hypothetical protein
MPTVEHKPGLAAEMLRELAPLLAEEGIDVDNIDNIDVPDLDTLQAAQLPSDRLLVAHGGQVGGRRAIPRNEDDEIGVKPIPDASRLSDEIVAVLDEEPDLAGCIGQPNRRESGLSSGHPSNRQGITRIGLAGPTGPLPLAVTEVGRDFPDLAPGGDEEAGRGRAEAGRALEPDPGVGQVLVGPAEQGQMPGRIVGKRPLVERLTELIEGARRERRLVGIDPDRGHHRSSNCGDTMGAGQAGSCALSEATLL